MVALTAIVLAVTCQRLVACPFCTALGPSLAQRREQAAVVALAEVISPAGGNDKQSLVRLHRVSKGRDRIGDVESLSVPLDVSVKSGTLVILFGDGDPRDSELAWHAVPVNETSYAYFARSPSLKTPEHQRLEYFARYLEHRDPLIAEDAYLEFGHAPFDEIAQVADLLPGAKLRAWLVDPGVPQSRKGFYGLAIALAAPAERRAATAAFLRKLLVAPEDDFRAGFDGVLGGYLLLAGKPGLELIESRYLANPDAADGDVRHALTAIRFYCQYGHEITATQLGQALSGLLERSEFAESAITDLARMKAWDTLDRVVKVYGQSSSDERIRRAVVGYLLACPEAKAPMALDQLRRRDPQGVAAAERVLSATSGLPSSE